MSRKKSTEPLRYTNQVDECGNPIVENISDCALLENDEDSEESDSGRMGAPIIVVSRDRKNNLKAQIAKENNEFMSSGSGIVVLTPPTEPNNA